MKSLLTAIAKLAQLIRYTKPDVVHAHMVTSALLVSIINKYMKFPFVTTVHNEFENSATFMKVGHRVIGVSSSVSQSMVGRGIPAFKMRTVLNGTIDAPRFRGRVRVPKTLIRPSIVFVGGLHARKGVLDLINAHAILLRQFPHAHLYLVGRGPDEKLYEAEADKLPSGSVTFCGHTDDPLSYLLAADIFVLPSHNEPAGLVISEAREAGCAIVASDVGGIPEMLSNGAAGVLVPSKRPDLLAKELIKLVGDPVYLASMREQSQVGLGEFAVSRVATETLLVYRELQQAN